MHSQQEVYMVLLRNAEAEAADTNYLKILKRYKNSAYNQQSWPISHIIWTD